MEAKKQHFRSQKVKQQHLLQTQERLQPLARKRTVPQESLLAIRWPMRFRRTPSKGKAEKQKHT
jgi:hypothetical protein